MTYQYFYQNENGNILPIKEPVSMETSFKTVMPETKKIFVKIVDDLGGNVIQSLDVNITVNENLINSTNIDQLTSEFLSKANDKDKLIDFVRVMTLWTGSLEQLSLKMPKEWVNDFSTKVVDAIQLTIDNTG